MTEVKFTIDPEEAKAALRETLAETLKPEMRAELVKQALATLITKPRYDGSSELQQIFNNSAGDVAREIFREEFDKPETRAMVRDLAVAAFEKVINDPDRRDKLIEKVADAIGQALSGSRY